MPRHRHSLKKSHWTQRNERPTPHLSGPKIWGAVGTTMVLHHQNHLQMDKQWWIFPCQLWCMENGSENGMFLDDLPIKLWFTQFTNSWITGGQRKRFSTSASFMGHGTSHPTPWYVPMMNKSNVRNPGCHEPTMNGDDLIAPIDDDFGGGFSLGLPH